MDIREEPRLLSAKGHGFDAPVYWICIMTGKEDDKAAASATR